MKPAKLCECGCGQAAPLAKANDKRRGYVKGQPTRFVHGHTSQIQAARDKAARLPIVLCACGCGERTVPNPHSPGEMNTYVHGHNSRVAHPAYTGGRLTNADGYVELLMPDHPRATARGYVKEHVFVAERALGRPLPPKAVVHHVNRDTGDNRPSNLVICEDAAYHNLLHQRMRALAACGHADWLKCPYCKRYDARENLSVYRRDTGHAGHHVACHNRYALERYHARKEAACEA